MDWLVDRGDTGSMDRALTELEEHLRRHAAPGARVEAAMAPVRAAVRESHAEGEGLLWLSIDWRAVAPRVSVAELAAGSRPAASASELGTALAPGAAATLAGSESRQLAETTLDLERPGHEGFVHGPPPMASVAADPRHQGAASVAVALNAAAKAHPSANAAQLATLAGAMLADNVAFASPPVDGPEVAAMLLQAHQGLGSEMTVLSADDESVDVAITRCPFGVEVSGSPALCHVSTAMAGRLGARVNGTATVALPESIAAGDPACQLHVRLGDATDTVRGEVHRWPPVAGTPSGDAPHLELSVNLPSETASVPVVRQLAAHALRSFGVAEPDVGDVQVAITEACANVIKHAVESDTYEVQVELAADQCAITVIDQGGGFDATAVPENPGPRSQGGRGLALIRALTDNVAFRNEPQDGTVVHMTKRLAHDTSHPLWRRPKTVD